MNGPLLHRLLTASLWSMSAGLSACSSDDGPGGTPEATGGAVTGGAPSGGTATGGIGASGAATGSTATGGDPSGGTTASGAATGGTAAGGDASGGATTGGAASGGGPAAGGTAAGGTTASDQFPADTSAEGIAAFLATEGYRAWAHQPAPYPPGELPFHGDLMLAYFNEVALATHDDAALYAMTVKEFYDTSGNQVGIAAALKTSEEDDRWTYYCTEDLPGGRCTKTPPDAYPVYEREQFYVGCALCHSDAIISPLP